MNSANANIPTSINTISTNGSAIRIGSIRGCRMSFVCRHLRKSRRQSAALLVIELGSVEFTGEVGDPLVGDAVVGRLPLVFLDQTMLDEVREGLVDGGAAGLIAWMNLDVVVHGRAGHVDARFVEDLQHRVASFVHPDCSLPHAVIIAVLGVLASPISWVTYILCPLSGFYNRILYILSKTLSTIDINGLVATHGAMVVSCKSRGDRCWRTVAPWVRTVMQAMTPQGLETPATTVEPPPARRRDLSHADALELCQEDQGAGVRVTASSSSQTTLGEGHLRFEPDQ